MFMKTQGPMHLFRTWMCVLMCVLQGSADVSCWTLLCIGRHAPIDTVYIER
jgi:hypothetical protein